MKYGLKKLLALTIALALLVGMLALPAWAEPAEILASGYCGGEGDGTNLTWELTWAGVLTISGEGKMEDWESPRYVPWYSYSNNFVKNLIIEDDVTSIGDCAFCWNSNLTEVPIPDSVTSIGNYAFYDCDNLTTVILPASVTTVGDYAFSSCTRLSAIRFEGDAPAFETSDPSFGNQTFGGVTATAYYPAGNKTWTKEVRKDYGGTITWKSYPSGYCGGEGDGSNLTWALTEDGTLTISGEGKMADYTSGGAPWYSRRSSINSVVIGDAVTTIGRDAFKSCKTLVTVTIPDSVTTIGVEAFYDCTSLISVDIPDSVTLIRRHAFADCSSLATVTISESLKTIEQSVFSGCTSLTTVTIPSSITAIAERAFANCTGLTEIRFEGDAPSFVYAGEVFLYVNATAYYPAGNDTWTKNVTHLYYGGNITWVSATAIQCDSCTETGAEVTVSAGADVTGTMVGYIAIYDKDGRFLRAEMVEEQVSSAGSLQLSIDYTEEESLQIGRISVYVIDRDTWIPLCREWRKTVNF